MPEAKERTSSKRGAKPVAAPRSGARAGASKIKVKKMVRGPIVAVRVMNPMAILGAEDWRDTGTTAKLACARIGTGKLFELEQAGWLTAGEVIEYVLPKRTLTHRREKREPLSVEESDRLLRIARLTEQAVKTFGNEEKAKAWLRRPSPRFDGNSPLELTRTEHGGRVVEEALIQIDEGLFA